MPVNEATRRILDDQPWVALLKRLTAYATKKIRERHWHGAKSETIPGGKSAADVASDAIIKVYSGERNWNPVKDPNLTHYLYDVVDSLISSAVTGSENTERRVASSDELEMATRTGNALGRDPSDDDFVLGFHQELDGEPDLQQVVECVIEGHIERADIAERLNVTPADITNRRHRMERRYSTFCTRVYSMDEPTQSPNNTTAASRSASSKKGSTSHAR